MIAKCSLLEPFYCKESDSVPQLTKKLLDRAQRHIFVTDAAEKPVGIISVTDILDRVVAAGKSPNELTAKDIMTTSICVFDDGDDARQAYKCMTEKKVASVPVTQHGKFIGTLTFNQALRFVTNPEHQ